MLCCLLFAMLTREIKFANGKLDDVILRFLNIVKHNSWRLHAMQFISLAVKCIKGVYILLVICHC